MIFTDESLSGQLICIWLSTNLKHVIRLIDHERIQHHCEIVLLVLKLGCRDSFSTTNSGPSIHCVCGVSFDLTVSCSSDSVVAHTAKDL